MPPWLKKLLDWIGYLSSAWTALGWLGWTSGIVGTATGVAAFLLSAVENWSPTAVLLAGLAGGVLASALVLLAGIAYRHIRPVRKVDGDEQVHLPTITQTPPPPWTPLLTVRRWATEAGWNFDPHSGAMGHNSGWDFTNSLRQAAVDGAVRFRGRRYTIDWPEHSKGQEVLVDVPAEHFRDYLINSLHFVRAERNYDTFTGQLAKQREQLTGQIYRDLEVDTAQIQTWLLDHKPSSTPPASTPLPQKWLSVAEAIDELADKKLLAAKNNLQSKLEEAFEDARFAGS